MKLKLFLFGFIFCSYFSSCTENTFNKDPEIQGRTHSKEEKREIFAQILAKAVINADIRDFIKNEALKQINNDYDVIYHYVKNQKLANGKTFRENLSQYNNIEVDLDELTADDPLLTILVPYLDTFSAESWDTASEIPSIAIRTEKYNERIKAFKGTESYNMSRKHRPQEPVLVIKTNDRLIINNRIEKSTTSENFLFKENNIQMYFIDDAFNNVNQQNKETKALVEDNVSSSIYYNDEKIFNAYFSIGKDSPRDYIYYGISPTKGIKEGKLNKEYREFLTSIQFYSYENLGHVASTNDPTEDWTDGNLELIFDFLTLSQNSVLSTIKKMLSVKISDVFVNGNGVKEYILPDPLNIFCWDVYKYGDAIKVVVSESDPGTTSEITTSVSSTYGSNFKDDGGIDLGIIKIGSEYNGSESETKQSSTKITTTNATDQLGEAIIEFFEPLKYGTANRFTVNVLST